MNDLRDVTPDFGADLQTPELYLTGAILLYGYERVVDALAVARREAAARRGGRLLVKTDEDGTPVYLCACGRDFAGDRACPLCAARSLASDDTAGRWHFDDAEALGLLPEDAA